jgi:starch synthase
MISIQSRETRTATSRGLAENEISPSVLLSHPTGNQNVRNALLALVEHEVLGEFWTAIAWNPESKWGRVLPANLRQQLERRAFSEAPRDRVHCVPSRELVRLATRSTPLEKLLCSGERAFSVIGMYRHFDACVARRLRNSGADVVYAYEGGALNTFREARRLGIKTLYELTTGHWEWKRKLLQEEAQRNPESAPLLSQLKDSDRHLAEKSEELRLADLVFVPSQHVRQTLAGVVADEKIRVVGYGAPPPVKPRDRHSGDDVNRPLKVLFAGALSRQKGIGYLLDAVDSMGKQINLTLIGRRLGVDPRVDEACNKHRWFQTVPHQQVLEKMTESDVLVLPSFSEGFGLVVTEALACGLPVIVTPNVGASDLIRDGKDGFVVPVASAEAIADRLNALDQDRELLAQMSLNAQNSAAQQSWAKYRQHFAENVETASCR